MSGIYRNEAPRFAVFADQPSNSVGTSAGKKEFMVDGFLAKLSIGIVLPIRSSPLATGLPVLPCTGIAPVALGFCNCGTWIRRVKNSLIRCL